MRLSRRLASQSGQRQRCYVSYVAVGESAPESQHSRHTLQERIAPFRLHIGRGILTMHN
jgi:hypothetical protein